jgi:NAD(P)H-hydrate epimerase
MRHVLTPDQMYALEARHFATSDTPSMDLMERAADEFVRELRFRLGSPSKLRAFVACGPGNNGGDGYAIARLLREAGAHTQVIRAFPELSERGDAAVELERAGAAGVPIADSMEGLDAPDLWVDAIFGIGFSRAAEARALQIFERIANDRARGAFVASVDLPSGIDGLTGRAAGGATASPAARSRMHRKPVTAAWVISDAILSTSVCTRWAIPSR